MIKIGHCCIEEQEVLYGPGKRLVIWVQGCTLHCKGCVNKELWDKNKGKSYSSDYFVDIVKSNNLDGITLLGGEPMQQSEQLLPLVKNITNLGKSIVCFTGYEIDELKKKSQIDILNLCDFLICGRFIESQRNLYLQFRGSDNQKVYFPNGKYKDYKLKDGTNMALFTITPSGSIDCKGFQPDELIDFVTELAIKTDL